MLDEKHDGKMAKHNSLCSEGGNIHTFDEYGLCFECDKSKEQVHKEHIENVFREMFNAKSARLIFDQQDFSLTGVVEMSSHKDDVLYIGILEKR